MYILESILQSMNMDYFYIVLFNLFLMVFLSFSEYIIHFFVKLLLFYSLPPNGTAISFLLVF